MERRRHMTDKESDIALMDALIELAETAAIYGDYNGESGRTYNQANAVLALIQSDRERAVKKELEHILEHYTPYRDFLDGEVIQDVRDYITLRINQLTKEQAA